MMTEATTISFQDAETLEDAFLIVRYDAGRVALAVSLKSNGDIEVVMTKDKAKSLRDALNKAIN